MNLECIPEGWSRAELQQLVYFQRGFDITKAQQKPGDIPVISSSGVTSFHNEAKAEGPGIVIGRKGTLGSIHFSDTAYWPHDTTLWSKGLSGNNARFVYYYLHLFDFQHLDVGNANPTLNRNHIHILEVAIPPRNIQDFIANILCAYDDLIATNQRRIQLLEDAARRLYREWFVHLRFPGHESVPVKDGLPEEWEKQSLSSVADVNARTIGSRNRPDSVLYIDISSVTPGLISSATPYTFADAPGRARRQVRHGDVIWSCVRPNRRSYALIWEPDEKLVASTGFAVLSATGVPFSYLYLATTTDDFVGYLEQHATGAAYPAVTAKTFEEAVLVVPDAITTAAFDRIVLPLLEQMETLKSENIALAQARDLLLPKLMSGQLDVSGIPLPEEVAA